MTYVRFQKYLNEGRKSFFVRLSLPAPLTPMNAKRKKKLKDTRQFLRATPKNLL